MLTSRSSVMVSSTSRGSSAARQRRMGTFPSYRLLRVTQIDLRKMSALACHDPARFPPTLGIARAGGGRRCALPRCSPFAPCLRFRHSRAPRSTDVLLLLAPMATLAAPARSWLRPGLASSADLRLTGLRRLLTYAELCQIRARTRAGTPWTFRCRFRLDARSLRTPRIEPRPLSRSLSLP